MPLMRKTMHDFDARRKARNIPKGVGAAMMRPLVMLVLFAVCVGSPWVAATTIDSARLWRGGHGNQQHIGGAGHDSVWIERDSDWQDSGGSRHQCDGAGL